MDRRTAVLRRRRPRFTAVVVAAVITSAAGAPLEPLDVTFTTRAE
jgi:hypothetical protein